MPETHAKGLLGYLRFCIEGTLLGAVLGAAMTLNALVDALLDDRISGVSSPAIHRFLATEFRAEVVRAMVLVFALSILTGSGVGLAVSLVDSLRARWLDCQDSPKWRWLRLSMLWGFVTVLVYFQDVAARPALHQSEWFERGGIRRAVQIVVSDGLGPRGVALVGALAFLAYLIWPLRSRIDCKSKARNLAIAAFFLAVVGGAAAVAPWVDGRVAAAAASNQSHPNVLLIAADSLRPDRIDETRAPHLTELARRSSTFERAITPLARTFPAWVSISTGQYPHHHGIRHMFPRWETRERPLSTLAQRFAAAGYRTSVVGDFAADIFQRIDLGYQTVKTPTFTLRELVREHLFKNDPRLLSYLRGSLARWLVPAIVEMHEATDPWAVSQSAIGEMDAARGKPFFLTVFYSTTHFPYATPGPFHARFRSSGYTGPFRYAKADELNPDGVISPSDTAQIRALYDGAVYATDDAIGGLLEALRRRGLASNTIVVITADHGEQLYENGRSQGHGDNLEGDESLRVPLIIHEPRETVAHRYESSVSLVDLAPTLLELSGLAALPSADGRSLAPAVRGQALAPVAVYSETGLWFTEAIAEVPLSRRLSYPDLTRLTEVDRTHGDQIVIRKRYESFAVAAKHRMVELDGFRLLYLPTREGPKFELFKIDTDPGMTRDVSLQYSEAVGRLKRALFAFVDTDPFVDRRGEILWPK